MLRHMQRSLWVVLFVALSLLLSGCPGPAAHTSERVEPGFGVADVERIEVYTYAFSDAPADILLSVLTDRRELATWVSYLTDLPTSPAHVDAAALTGSDADGFRFHLRDGSTYEVTHLFVGPNLPGGVANFLVWPDGTVKQTDFGSPTGLTGTAVEAGMQPRAVIGR